MISLGVLACFVAKAKSFADKAAGGNEQSDAQRPNKPPLASRRCIDNCMLLCFASCSAKCSLALLGVG